MMRECRTCGGTGRIANVVRGPVKDPRGETKVWNHVEWETCPTCNGTGREQR